MVSVGGLPTAILPYWGRFSICTFCFLFSAFFGGCCTQQSRAPNIDRKIDLDLWP